MGGSRNWNRGLAAAAVTVLALLVPTGAAGRANPADTAATRAYLQAAYTYAQAEIAGIPAAISRITPLVNRIGGECPAVLAAAPALPFREPPATSPRTERESGEQNRRWSQLLSLETELSAAALAPFYEGKAAAEVALLAATRPLHWTDAAITRGVQAYVGLFESRNPPAPANVCADMRAWVASGYRKLSAATKAFVLASRSSSITIGGAGPSVVFVEPTSPALRRYEGRAELALAKRLTALHAQLLRLEEPLRTLAAQVEKAVGIRQPLSAEEPKKGRLIARGRTAAGEGFVARVEREPHLGPCALSISIESESEGEGVRLSSGFGGCIARNQRDPEPSVNCDSGRLVIRSATLPATRQVRLLLSDGRTITSSAILLAKRFGGPAGIYYQVVRGPSPIPVSLTELDAHGHALRTVKLPAIVECTEHPVKYLPGGRRTLARGQVPGGAAFTIVAERYRFLGKVHFDLKLNEQLLSQSGFFSVGVGEGGSGGGALRNLFGAEESTGCTPQPYMIVYGILSRPQDTVLARTASGLVPLTKVAIPARMHAGGVLAYGVFSPPPLELLVRAPNGRTVAREPGTRSRATVERCEGEAEG